MQLLNTLQTMEFKLLNSEAIEATKFRTYPYKLGLLKNVLKESSHRHFEQFFPSLHFCFVKKQSEEKSYQMYVLPLLKEGREIVEGIGQLDGKWLQLLNEIQSEKYLNLMSRITGITLENALLEVNLWEYASGSNLSVHTDKKEKLITHLIFFNPVWEDDWGGHFCIHTANDDQAIFDKILPTSDNSIILITADDSWHSVTSVTSKAPVKRRGLQIIFKITNHE